MNLSTRLEKTLEGVKPQEAVAAMAHAIVARFKLLDDPIGPFESLVTVMRHQLIRRAPVTKV